jgi:HD-GYP domain-containing protein (c-di-GMP phosphodiesterase class II)
MFMEQGAGGGHGEDTAKRAAACKCSGACGGMGACATQTAHELAESLGRAVDARDNRLFQHSELVAELSSMLASAHGLTPRQASMVHMAAHLHDIGKIGIPDHILHKPGPLDPAEWQIMRQHPRLGADIIRPVRVFGGSPGVCEMVLTHHERFNGSGYPLGLAGTAIPLGARIIAVADAFCAMTEERPYCRSRTLDEAVAEIERGSGIMFDPHVVQDFLTLRPALEGLMEAAAAEACQSLAASPERQPALCHLGSPSAGGLEPEARRERDTRYALQA